jgi:hypothetical protein
MMLVFALALAAIPVGEPTACPNPTHYDGDDIRCDSDDWRALAGKGGMRLGKIDAPEMRCSKYTGRKTCQTAKERAIASRDHLRSLTRAGKVVCTWTGERTSEATGSRPVVMCSTATAGDLSCRQWRTGHARYVPRFDRKKLFRKRCKA